MVRVKKRYLCVSFQRRAEVERGRKKGSKRALEDQPLDSLSDPNLYSEIRAKVQEIHGDFGVASVTSGLRIIYVNPATKLCLIQVRHGAHRIVASVLPFMTRLKDEAVIPRLIYTGATVRNCYQRVKSFQTEELRQALRELDEVQDAPLKEALAQKIAELDHPKIKDYRPS